MGLHLIASWGWLSLESWSSVLLVMLSLGLVIFVHELGHFAVAKMCGVKCEKFYIGFDVPIRIGPLKLPAALWKRKWGETEYGVGIFPLGGYVKMLGQDDNPSRSAEAAEASRKGDPTGPTGPAALDPRSYPAKSVPQRMAIISAGVIMNVIFAYIFALIAILVGVPYVPCTVGYTQPGEPAWRANLHPRDRVVEINGVKNPRFDDFQQQVVLADPKKGIQLTIERPTVADKFTTFDLTLRPDQEATTRRLIPRVGVVMASSLTLNTEMPAIPDTTAAGLPEGQRFIGGDKLVEIDGQAITDSIGYQTILTRDAAKPLKFVVERKTSPEPEAKPQRVTVEVPATPWRHLGLSMTLGPVSRVQEDSPATKATAAGVEGGIQPGDRITAIDGQPVGDPMSLPMRLAAMHGQKVKVQVERPGDKGATQKIEFTTEPIEPTWFADFALEDSPVALLALGVTCNVDARVAQVDPQGPAADKGINVGDEVVSATFAAPQDPKTPEEKELASKIKGMKPLTFSEKDRNWPALISVVQSVSPQTIIRLSVRTGDKTRQVDVKAVASKVYFNPDRGLRLNPNEHTLVVKSAGEAFDFAWRETKHSLLAVYIFLRKLSLGQLSPKLFGGPVTIAVAAWSSAQAGLGKLLLFLTLLSANLAVVNFLPIPVLDGGHMVFLTLEGIFRRPVSEKIVVPLTYAGLFLILTLMMFVFYLDWTRFSPF